MREAHNIHYDAYDPSQYDKMESSWAEVGSEESTRTKFYIEHLQPFFDSFRNKKVLDIGAGTGWLVDAANKHGATMAVGVEPSSRHVKIAQDRYAGASIVHNSFEEFYTNEQFDVVTAIMSLSHIEDLNRTFQKIEHLTAENAKLIIAVPGFEYTRTPHAGCSSYTPVDDMSYIAVTGCSGGQTITDMVRSNEVYEHAGRQVGFLLKNVIPTLPTEEQMKKSSRFIEAKNEEISTLLLFDKI